jgi:ATP-binding cassette, subfamily B, bacterial
MDFPFQLQSGPMNCGPACLKMIADYYGLDRDLDLITAEAGLNEEGVTLFGLYTAASNMGFRVESVSLTLDELLEGTNPPSILYWGEAHYVVFTGRTEAGPNNLGNIEVADPAAGMVRLDTAAFCSKFINAVDEKGRPTGIALLILPPKAEIR